LPALLSEETERPLNRHQRRAVAAGCELDDVLNNVGEIAEFLFKENTPKNRRRVYRLASGVAVDKRLPIFRYGNQIRARRSRLLAWIEAQEDANAC
jgi:hypothetical protein